MNLDKLVQMHRAAPFKPFRIHLSDRGHLDVAHPDFLAHTPTGRTVVVTQLDETFTVIDLLHVARLEILKHRRRKKPQRNR